MVKTNGEEKLVNGDTTTATTATGVEGKANVPPPEYPASENGDKLMDVGKNGITENQVGSSNYPANFLINIYPRLTT